MKTGRSKVVEWKRLPRHKWPKSRSNIEDPVVPLEHNLHGHPLAGLSLGEPVRGCSVGTWMGNRTELRMSIRSSKTGIVLVGIRGCHQRGLEKQNMALTNQHHCLTMCIWNAQ